jgi:hypothetical protein
MKKIRKNGANYYYDGNTTVCLLMEDGVPVARGISVASNIDDFDPSFGRKQSLDRARKAYGTKSDVERIDLFAVRYTPYDWFSLSLAKDHFGEFKGYYNPNLTSTEKLLIASDWKKVITLPLGESRVKKCITEVQIKSIPQTSETIETDIFSV